MLKKTILIAVSLILSSCSSSAPNQSDEETNNTVQRQTTENTIPENVVKVLNRVTCENMACTQEDINKMWQVCLSQGWSDQPTEQKIRSSRDLRELVTGNVVYTEVVNENVEKTDPSGIVTIIPSQRTIERPATITGYCIGSEYITS